MFNWLDKLYRKWFPVSYIRRYLRKNKHKIIRYDDYYCIDMSELYEMTKDQMDKAVEKGFDKNEKK